MRKPAKKFTPLLMPRGKRNTEPEVIKIATESQANNLKRHLHGAIIAIDQLMGIKPKCYQCYQDRGFLVKCICQPVDIDVNSA